MTPRRLICGALIGLTAGLLVSDQAAAGYLRYDCSLENVAGVFGYNLDTESSPARQRPGAGLGLLDLKANGDAMLIVKAFLERGGELRMLMQEGTWSIDENCFGFIDFPEDETTGAETDYGFIAVENATELFMIRNNPLQEIDAKLLYRR